MVRLCVFLFFVAVAPLWAAEFSGTARIIDGDTVAIRGDAGEVVVRLFGIDAPERDQWCPDAHARNFPCGADARRALSAVIGARNVRCTPLYPDRYGRVVARCDVSGRDLGRTMVRTGAAFASARHSDDYVAVEQVARSARAGVWAGKALRPAVFRAASRASARQAQPDPEGCTIKGNITSSGRIFHRPGSAAYRRTRIDPSRGERWFCSARAARAAGWREARR